MKKYRNKPWILVSICSISLFVTLTISACGNQTEQIAEQPAAVPEIDDSYIENDEEFHIYEDTADNTGIYQFMTFADYSGMTPFYTDKNLGGAYGEKFKTNINTAYEYREFIELCGYTYNENTSNDKVWFLNGNTDNEFVIVSFETDGIGFIYGSDTYYSGNSTYSYNPPLSVGQKTLCPMCSGTGKVICKGCNGLGYIASIKYGPDFGYGSSPYEVKNHCYTCGGSGQSMCTSCFGTGYIQ